MTENGSVADKVKGFVDKAAEKINEGIDVVEKGGKAAKDFLDEKGLDHQKGKVEREKQKLEDMQRKAPR